MILETGQMKIQTLQICLFVMMTCMLNGCSSMMTHTGNEKSYYPGTLANNEIISNKNNHWNVKVLAVIDYPFSLILDTVLLPWDYFHHSDNRKKSLREQVAETQSQTP